MPRLPANILVMVFHLLAVQTCGVQSQRMVYCPGRMTGRSL